MADDQKLGTAGYDLFLGFYLDPLLQLTAAPHPELTTVLATNKAASGAIKMMGGPWAQAEELATLSSRRTLGAAWLGSGAESKTNVTPHDVERIGDLAGRMTSFAQAVGQLPGFNCSWSSPLALSLSAPWGMLGAAAAMVVGGGGTHDLAPGALEAAAQKTVWSGQTVQQDAAMWCFTYAAALRQRALQQAAQAQQADSGSAPGTPAAAAAAGSEGAAGGSDGGAANSQAAIVALLRRAAGVFDHMATNVLPILPVALGPYASKDRLALELQIPVCRALEVMCRAEAQALTTVRARVKGVSPATEAGLEAGCASLYAAARQALATGIAGHQQPSRLIAYLTAAQAWHEARARTAQAKEAESRAELGEATATAQAGVAAMSEALKVAGSMPGGSDPTWRSMLSAESSALTAMAARLDRDRVKVAMQPMPRTLPALPEPKVLVGAALAHAPPSYTPPPPPPEAEKQARGQNCCVQ